MEIPTTQQDYSHLESSMAKMMMETINNMLIEMYAVFSQLEIKKKEQRQREGIATKKARGEWDDYGRPAAIDYKQFGAFLSREEQSRLRHHKKSLKDKRKHLISIVFRYGFIILG